jgi:trehalose/maltose hydrolase-like predicted phosphorylase
VSSPISPKPARHQDEEHLPPYVSNGVIGLRVRSIPLIAGVAIVNGAAGEHPETRTESAPFVPYPLEGDIVIDGVSMSENLFRAEPIDQAYDFSCGELTSRFRFRTARVEVRAETVTFCSRTQPRVVVQQTTIETDAACDVEMKAGVTFEDIAGRQRERTGPMADSLVDGSMCFETFGDLARVGVAYSTQCSADAERSIRTNERTGPLQTSYSFRARTGAKYVLTQVAALVETATNRLPDQGAVRLVARAMKCGVDVLRADNRAAWDALWARRVVLRGADQHWQALADAAFFYLNTSAHSGSTAGTHIFGLSQWMTYHHYYGQAMWDIEAFAAPIVALTQPDAARTLLEFRWRTRDRAEANARANGYRGMQFPWQAGASGEEAAPGDGMGAAFAHHVSLGVAHAFAQFGFITGDAEFLRARAWPVLVGVTEFLRSRVTHTARGFEIQRSMGIAERAEPTDNGVYMNVLAKTVLREARAVAASIGHTPPPWWEPLEHGLVIPMDHEGKRLISHDGFHPNEEKGSTPDALAAIFPLGYPLDEAVERATLEYFLDRADDYVGQPMLSALYGAWAARLGDRKQATRLFTEGYAKFVSDRFTTTYEWRPDKFPEYPRAGPFVANLAGFLLSLVYGLTRMDVGPGAPDSWCRGPIVMPDLWDAVEIEGFIIHGRVARLRAAHGDTRASLELGDLVVI